MQRFAVACAAVLATVCGLLWWALPAGAGGSPVTSGATSAAASSATASALAASAAAPAVPAPDKDVAVPALPELEDDEPAPGLALRLTSTGGGEDVRVARMVALRVPAGQPVSPFVAPGRVTAVWKGDLRINFRDDYAFSADGRGKFVLEVNGKVVLTTEGEDLSKVAGEPVQLKKGANKIIATYTAPADGEAWVRLYWTPAETKMREPIPWLAWAGIRRHDPSDEGLRTAQRLRLGRELITTLRCLKCHTDAALGSGPGAVAVAPGSMPELAMDAPDLSTVGARLRPEWVARWVVDPKSLRPDTAMPACLPEGDSPEVRAEAADIAAFLATQGKPAPDPAAPAAEVPVKGGRLFSHLGCVSCHTLPSREDWKDAPDRIALRNVATKWRPAALAEFLRRPDSHYKWIRMPDFALTEAEAGQLAAYVLSAGAPVPEVPADPGKGDAARGKLAYEARGCVSCHAATGAAVKPTAPVLAAIRGEKWGKGCLAPDAAGRGKAPRFGLADGQRAALAALAAAGPASLLRESPVEFAERQIRLLRCQSCHKRDEKLEDPWGEHAEETEGLLTAAAELGDLDPEKEKHFPPEQVRPTLTWTGEKLRPEWSAEFIAGKLSYKPRPYLRARMPAFRARAELLAQGMALDHGMPAVAGPNPEPDPAKAAIGRTLAKKNGGLSCVTCHDVGKTEAVGVFEAPGVNLMHVRERLIKPFYDRWMLSPVRVETGTKMPQFYKEGKTDIRGVLEGDAHKQFDVLWHYLLVGGAIRPPEE